MTATLEHANLTVADPDATAAWMGEVFGWAVRWSGPAKDGGYTVHVGGKGDYLALYRPATPPHAGDISYGILGGLNHVGVVVPDLDATEARVKAMGFVPNNHADYEPGHRFYFLDSDGIEFEVVHYDD
ncbi:MAG: VOC family protein [Antarcticimicrobium sp.]|uniref:VOC family protein n=1 Tax=Antarcticimicrobium sp. TaxID=2824147 RepID=UPI0026233FE0|nr:VOC family protein [Antarcticimicrobium sp.]MDF1715360.1 VOC family protein [Antarcticimicrobium sp.]